MTMISARWLFTLIAILCAGCSPVQVNAGFPEVPPPPTAKSDAPKIGLARVADSRVDRTGGWLMGDVILVGPELNDYIERKFRSALVEQGFAPIEALNPTSTTNPAEYKIIVVTLQSTDIGRRPTASMVAAADASVDIAVQIYAPGNRKVVFAQSYHGTHSEALGFIAGLGMNSGSIIAAAADSAIDEAFADEGFEKALK
jgi:hypothetical protein